MAMDASDGGLGLGGSFVDNTCFRAFFARRSHWSEGVRGGGAAEGVRCHHRISSTSEADRHKRILFAKPRPREMKAAARLF
jgi:hypothetical protein